MNSHLENMVTQQPPLRFSVLCNAKGISSPSKLRDMLWNVLPLDRRDALASALPSGLTVGALRLIWHGKEPAPALLLEEAMGLPDLVSENRQQPDTAAVETVTVPAEARDTVATFAPRNDWDWDNSEDGLPVSGTDIIAAMARDLAPDEVLWGASVVERHDARGWKGRAIGRADAANGGTSLAWLSQAENANHVSMGAFTTEALSRSDEDLRGAVRIVLDDVGTKAKFPDLPPTMVIETSPGNYQISYFLDGVERGIPRVKALLAELARLGLTDKDAGSTVRYFRVPGSNVKPEHKGFRDKVRVWAPARRFTLAQVAKGLGIVLQAPGTAQVTSAKISPDALLAPGKDDEARGEIVDRMLACIKNDDRFISRESWVEIGLALWAACGGDPAGRDAFVHWSHGDPAKAERLWDTFKDAKTLGYSYVLDRLHEDCSSDPQARRLHTELQNRRAKEVFGAFSNELVAQISVAAERIVPEHIRHVNADHAYVIGVDRVAEFDERGRVIGLHAPQAFARALDNNRNFPRLGTNWLKHPDRRTYKRIGVFAPGDERPGDYNLWRGLNLDAQPGVWPTIREYLLDVVCDGDRRLFDWLTQWLARMVRQPLERGETGVVLIGAQGTGKSTLYEMLERMLGSDACYRTSNGKHVLGNFNAAIEGRSLVCFEEAIFGHDRSLSGALKSLLTERDISIEAKGVNPRMSRNIAHIIITSNELAAVPLDADDRRLTVFRVSDKHANDRSYFDRLYQAIEGDELRAFAHWCQTVDLTGFDHRTPVMTSAKREMREAVAGAELAFWLNVFETGTAPGAPFEATWATTAITIPKDKVYQDYSAFARSRGAYVRAPQVLFGALRGYVPFEDTRPRQERDRDAQRPRSIILPPLPECRAAWDKRTGDKRPWTAPEPADSDGNDI